MYIPYAIPFLYVCVFFTESRLLKHLTCFIMKAHICCIFVVIRGEVIYLKASECTHEWQIWPGHRGGGEVLKLVFTTREFPAEHRIKNAVVT